MEALNLRTMFDKQVFKMMKAKESWMDWFYSKPKAKKSEKEFKPIFGQFAGDRKLDL